MNRNFTLALGMVASLLLGGCSSTVDSRENFVRAYFERYPKATLQDVYKGSFQDVFGPAHILTNRQAVQNYIESEMKSASGFPGEDFVPCGWKGQFYQVNLKVIADGRVPMDVFVDAFMQSRLFATIISSSAFMLQYMDTGESCGALRRSYLLCRSLRWEST
jgi:hypothetical protein